MHRILLADDHNLFREALKTVLTADADIELIGEAGDAATVVSLAESLRPDIVLMDLGMSGMSSLEATRRIKQNNPATKILMVSMYDDEEYVTQSMEAGASGYVLKEAAVSELRQAVRGVARGGSYLSPRLVTRLVDTFRSGQIYTAGKTTFGSLTAREREALKLLAEGKTVKEIATEWCLSVKTVEAHKFNLMRKLGIRNKAQLVHYAIQKKVIQLDPLRPDALS